MKNNSPLLPPVTYKEAIKLLNGLCEGLGDAMKYEVELFLGETHDEERLSDWVYFSFDWASSEFRFDFWNDINIMLEEIECGAGIKK